MQNKNEDQKNTQTRQSINVWRTYTGNANGALIATGGSSACLAGIEPDFYCGPLILCGLPLAIVTLLACPITATLGAGIKTVTDMHKRKPLLMSDIEQMCETLEYLDTNENNKKVDEISEAINTYRGGSMWHGLSKLQIGLHEIDEKKRDKEEHFKNEEKNTKIKAQQEKLNNLMKSKGITYFKAEPVYRFSAEEANEIKQHVADKMQEVNNEARTAKVELISNYLTSKHNAGKELQHYILDILQPIATEIKDMDRRSGAANLQVI